MGNRAVITSKENFNNNGIGIYLHWNGGRDSVESFLKYCELKGYRAPDKDNYGWARLVQVIGNFFGGSTSIGIDTINNLDCDNHDNGTYIIEGWKIVERKYFNGREQNEYDMNEMLIDIDEHMPKQEQMGDYLKAREIPIEELKVGDTVFMMNHYGEITKQKVMGIGADRFVNGTNVNGFPYVDLYSGCGVENNINNYIFTKTVRVFAEKE